MRRLPAISAALAVAAACCGLFGGCGPTKPQFILVTEGTMGVRDAERFYGLGEPVKAFLDRYEEKDPFFLGLYWSTVSATLKTKSPEDESADVLADAPPVQEPAPVQPTYSSSSPRLDRSIKLFLAGPAGSSRGTQTLEGVAFHLKGGAFEARIRTIRKPLKWTWAAANARTDKGIGAGATVTEVEAAHGPPTDLEQETGLNGELFDLLVYEGEAGTLIFRFDRGRLTAMGVMAFWPFAEGRGDGSNDAPSAPSVRAACRQGFAPAQFVLDDNYGVGYFIPPCGLQEMATSLSRWQRFLRDKEAAWSPEAESVDRERRERSARKDGTDGTYVYSYSLDSPAIWHWDMAAYRMVTEGYRNRHLGFLYLTGEGGEQDDAQAVRFFRESAELGCARAQYNLGLCFALGRGVAKDLEKALEWWRRAAALGFARAQYRLGLCCETGDGVTADRVEALKWYRESAAHGYPEARAALKRLTAADTPR